MLSQPFDFFAPTRLKEVLDLVSDEDHEVKLLAGGMSLLPVMNLDLAQPEVVVSLNHVDGMTDLRSEDSTLIVGGMNRHRDLAASAIVRDLCPVLAEAAGSIGDVHIRNRGTIGGSLAHADPSADYLTVLSALDASVVVRSRSGTREITVRELVVGVMTTTISEDEVLTEVRIPVGVSTGAKHLRSTRVEGALPDALACATRTSDHIVVACGGATAAPIVVTAPAESPLGAIASMITDALSQGYSQGLASPYRRALTATLARRAAAAV